MISFAVNTSRIQLTAGDLDFIINYDIKYRMGKDADTDDADGDTSE